LKHIIIFVIKLEFYLFFGLKIQIIIPIKSKTPITIPTGKTQRGHSFLSAAPSKLLPAFSNPSPAFLTPLAEASPILLAAPLVVSVAF